MEMEIVFQRGCIKP